jgi:hypothetical protein
MRKETGVTAIHIQIAVDIDILLISCLIPADGSDDGGYGGNNSCEGSNTYTTYRATR